MTKAVLVDKDVLGATADALTALASHLSGLLSAADRLDVGGEVAQLRAAPTWASETALDLRARIGLVERLQHGRTTFTSFTVSTHELNQIAGGSMPVDDQLYALEAAEVTRSKGQHGLDWDGARNFSDWIEKVEARALTQLPVLDDKGELIEKGIHAFDEYQDHLLEAGDMAAMAVGDLGTTQADSPLVRLTSRWGERGAARVEAREWALTAEWLRKGIGAVDSLYLGGRRTLLAPGTAVPWRTAQAGRYGPESRTFEEALDAARLATSARGGETVTGVDAITKSPVNPGNRS